MCAAVPLNSERKAEALERILTLCLFCVPNITEEVSTPLAKPLTLLVSCGLRLLSLCRLKFSCWILLS